MRSCPTMTRFTSNSARSSSADAEDSVPGAVSSAIWTSPDRVRAVRLEHSRLGTLLVLADTPRGGVSAPGWAGERRASARRTRPRGPCDQPRKIHLPSTGLRSRRQRPLHARVELRVGEREVEAMRLLEKAVVEWPAGGVDRPLRQADGRGREGGDPACEPIDERPELVRRQGPVDVAVPLGELGVEVLAAQDDLERAGASDEAREPLRAAPAREDAHRHLGLTEDRPP